MTTAKQQFWCRRNHAKFRLLGARASLQNISLTIEEKEKMVRILSLLGELITNWEEQNQTLKEHH